MEIRKTTLEDLPAVMALYDQGRQYMRKNGNHNQWIKGYPSEELIREDIQLGRSYVAEEQGELTAVFCFFYGKDIEASYRNIDGAWLDDEPYGVLHRIASSGKYPNMTGFCSDWCLSQWPNLRIDTHRDNAPMQRALERLGFTRCGVVIIEDGSERIGFQKRRESK